VSRRGPSASTPLVTTICLTPRPTRSLRRRTAYAFRSDCTRLQRVLLVISFAKKRQSALLTMLQSMGLLCMSNTVHLRSFGQGVVNAASIATTASCNDCQLLDITPNFTSYTLSHIL
jgi:hypothetical protein